MILDPEPLTRVIRECFRRGMRLPLCIAMISRNHQLIAGVYETEDGEMTFKEIATHTPEEVMHAPVNILIVDAEGKALHAITGEGREPEFLN